MVQTTYRRNARTLWVSLAMAALYDGVMFFRHGITGSLRLDGSLGVLLGLFICSRGAANLLDMILFGRMLQRDRTSRRADLVWVSLNTLILPVGYSVIVFGATQFARLGTNAVSLGAPWR